MQDNVQANCHFDHSGVLLTDCGYVTFVWVHCLRSSENAVYVVDSSSRCPIPKYKMRFHSHTVSNMFFNTPTTHDRDVVKNSFSNFVRRVPVLGGSHSTVGRKQKRKDKVDDHYELIYHLREESIIKILTGTFALATYGGLSALSIQACQYFLANETITQQAVENDLLLSTGLIAMMMPLSILAGKYCQMFPLRIYKHETS